MAAAAALVVGAFAAAWAARCTLSCAFDAAGCRSASLGCSQPAKSCRGHRSSGAEAKVLGRVRCPAPHEARPVRAVAREWGALHPHTHSFTPCTASHPRRGCLRGDLHAMMRIAPVSQAGVAPRRCCAPATRLPALAGRVATRGGIRPPGGCAGCGHGGAPPAGGIKPSEFPVGFPKRVRAWRAERGPHVSAGRGCGWVVGSCWDVQGEEREILRGRASARRVSAGGALLSRHVFPGIKFVGYA